MFKLRYRRNKARQMLAEERLRGTEDVRGLQAVALLIRQAEGRQRGHRCAQGVPGDVEPGAREAAGGPWLRTNGVNTNGAAAKVISSTQKVRKQKNTICSEPISADPICPFPKTSGPAAPRT